MCLRKGKICRSLDIFSAEKMRDDTHIAVTPACFFICHSDLFFLFVTPASEPESRLWREGGNQRKLVGGLRLSRTEGLRS